MNKKSQNMWYPLTQLVCWWKDLTGLNNQATKGDDLPIQTKQKIHPHSPAKDAQQNFINEGGNSQPLRRIKK